MDTTNHNEQTNVPVLQGLETVELQQVEGGGVTTAAIGAGPAIGWRLFEMEVPE